MARRFKKFGRRAASAVGRRFARRSSGRRSSGGSNPLMTIVLPGMAYGGIRSTVKGYLAPISSMLPLGENSDEAIMGLAGYFLMKNTSGFTSDLGKAAMYVESASIGHNIINPLLSGVQTSASAVYNY